MERLAALLGLGIIGFDFGGPAIVTSAITAKISKLNVSIFTITNVVARVLLGVMFSILGYGVISQIHLALPKHSSAIWAILDIVVVFLVSFWLLHSIAKSKGVTAKTKPPFKLNITKPWEFMLAGVLFALTLLTSSVFYGVVAICAQTHSLIQILLIQVVWTVFTQIPLIASALAYAFNYKSPILGVIKAWWQNHHQKITVGIRIVALILVLGLSANVFSYFLTKTYLF